MSASAALPARTALSCFSVLLLFLIIASPIDSQYTSGAPRRGTCGLSSPLHPAGVPKESRGRPESPWPHPQARPPRTGATALFQRPRRCRMLNIMARQLGCHGGLMVLFAQSKSTCQGCFHSKRKKPFPFPHKRHMKSAVPFRNEDGAFLPSGNHFFNARRWFSN